MSSLLVLTFADKPLTDTNHLKKSCIEFGIALKELISSPWIQNVIKLKLLYQFVQDAEPELFLLVVDAFDVVIYENEKTILEKFESLQTDIAFSGESNFMYKEPAKWLSFLRKYPNQRSIYKFLNSGSYMGKVKHIKEMLERMQALFTLDLTNEKKLIPIKSDQYLLSRFFVENDQNTEKLKIKIDANHNLLGVTGGRFCVMNFPDISRWQSFTFFILERNLLKLFKLHKHQKVPKDYVPMDGKFLNKKTITFPPVMHFPGTWDRFDKVYEDLLQQKEPSKKGSWIFAAMISLFAYPLSVLAAPIFWVLTRKF